MVRLPLPEENDMRSRIILEVDEKSIKQLVAEYLKITYPETYNRYTWRFKAEHIDIGITTGTARLVIDSAVW